MPTTVPDPGSFRDPAGRVYIAGDRVLRAMTPAAAADFRRVVETGLLDDLVAAGWLVDWTALADGAPRPAGAEDAGLVLEHPRLAFVSYPYEWPFGALKAAALRHLDIHLRALERGVTLVDASAYNMQFDGPRPVFIDHLSFRPYADGGFWLGHRQFCEQFLNPLLLRAYRGVPHNAWLRGAPEGMPCADLAALLPWYRRWSPRVATHVMLPASFDRRRRAVDAATADVTAGRRLAKSSLIGMLQSLRGWIAGLRPQGAAATVWSDYAADSGYADADAAAKRAFVEAFIADIRPDTVLDVGCNTGDFAASALEAGAARVIGLEQDPTAVEAAFARAEAQSLTFLPLVMDAANPSPAQGWDQRERPGFAARADADAVLALALVHHLAIGRNVPLDAVADWLVGLAPRGVIEFAPRDDPRVQTMLATRDVDFADYAFEALENAVAARARIVRTAPVGGSGRVLLAFDRTAA